ncbi:hypothetical protein AB0M83_02415 [Amycolatopsis sp. NPDC051106]|uniref:hypothetical protein n=1 Tax=unclassified Amycolatopsis TaxID=2618356 RepID=UPI00343E367A
MDTIQYRRIIFRLHQDCSNSSYLSRKDVPPGWRIIAAEGMDCPYCYPLALLVIYENDLNPLLGRTQRAVAA